MKIPSLSLNLLFLVASLFGCATPAKPPLVTNARDARTRERMFADYRLAEDRGFLSTTWKRSDGEYNWGELKDVAQQFPDSARLYGRATNRATVLGIVSGAGGGVVGYTLGYNLAAEEQNRMSGSTQAALYATGGGLILASVVMGLVWPNPADEFASTYNRELRQKLRLKGKRGGAAQGSRSSPSSAWVPVAAGPGGALWQF